MKSKATFKDLILLFLEGATEGISATGTLKIIGDQLVHYETPIAERKGKKIIINNSRYSIATGQLQKQIRMIVPEEMQEIVGKVPNGYNGSLLLFLNKKNKKSLSS